MATRFGESEPLDEGEVQKLLARIGEYETGGEHYATLGAVVEATGADPEFVARELLAIRADPVWSPVVVPPRVAVVTPSQVFLWVLIVIGVGGLLVSLAGIAASRMDAPQVTYSASVADGDVVFTPSRGVTVRKRDGTERAPTGDEQAMIMSIAASSGAFGR